MVGAKRPFRFRAMHRRMSFDTFERTIPVRPGWKREYYDGTAHVRPSWTMVTYRLRLGRQSETVDTRPVTEADAGALLDAFLDSFRYAPEYADYPVAAYRIKARQYIDGFFGTARGKWSVSSRAVLRNGSVAAAALVKERDGRCPLLDCLFVRPAYFRTGLATGATAAAVVALFDAGHQELTSHAMLANEPSLAWHHRFGFDELPDLWVAQARCYCARHEIERLESIGELTEQARERLSAIAERWWAEVQRLDQLSFERRFPIRDA